MSKRGGWGGVIYQKEVDEGRGNISKRGGWGEG